MKIKIVYIISALCLISLSLNSKSDSKIQKINPNQFNQKINIIEQQIRKLEQRIELLENAKN